MILTDLSRVHVDVLSEYTKRLKTENKYKGCVVRLSKFQKVRAFEKSIYFPRTVSAVVGRRHTRAYRGRTTRPRQRLLNR